MSRAGKAMQLGAVIVPVAAALNYSERIETFGGRYRGRTAAGAAVPQIAWERLRVTLSGSGWMPPGLAMLDFSAPMTLKCGLPSSVSSVSNVLTLPAARRTDAGYTPYAWAQTDTGVTNTAVSLSGDTATCTTVAGAVAYTVMYWPQLTVVCDPASLDMSRAGSSWEIVAEEA